MGLLSDKAEVHGMKTRPKWLKGKLFQHQDSDHGGCIASIQTSSHALSSLPKGLQSIGSIPKVQN